MKTNYRVILGCWVSMNILTPDIHGASAVDPSIVPLEALDLVFTNPFASVSFAASNPTSVRMLDGTFQFMHQRFDSSTLFPTFYSYPRQYALARASEGNKVIFAGNRVGITVISPLNASGSGLTALEDLSKATAGMFYKPAQLREVGSLTMTISGTPSTTSALAAAASPTHRERICWQQPIALYQANANGLFLKTPTSPAEGPGPNHDHNAFPLPDDFCR